MGVVRELETPWHKAARVLRTEIEELSRDGRFVFYGRVSMLAELHPRRGIARTELRKGFGGSSGELVDAVACIHPDALHEAVQALRECVADYPRNAARTATVHHFPRA